MSLLFDMPRPEPPVRLRFPAYKAVCVEEFSAADAGVEIYAETNADAVEAARRAGMMEARQAMEMELEHRLAAERELLQMACEGFARARETYFAGIERAIVGLALSIAAKVIDHEVKLDPLLLRGVVHVALQDVAAQDGVVLRVPLDGVAMWQESMQGLAVEGDALMVRGDCRLMSPVGVAELGATAQLAEIERGFFDVLAKRPA